MRLVDVADPDVGTSEDVLGDVRERVAAEADEVFALQVTLGALPGDGGDLLRAMLGRRRAFTARELPLVLGDVATSDDADAVTIQVQRRGQAERVGRHRVRVRVVHDVPGRSNVDRDAQR